LRSTSAEKDDAWLTLREAAERRGVTSHRIRKLIKAGILRAEQVVPGAPFQISAADLDAPSVLEAAGHKGRPCHVAASNQLPMFPDT
jgi:excisionase family DNA binding protein